MQRSFTSRLADSVGREWPTLLIPAAGCLFGVLAPQHAMAYLVASFVVMAAWLLIRGAPHEKAVDTPVVADVPITGQITALDLAAAVTDPLIIFETSSAIAYANEAARQAFGQLQDGMSMLLKFRAPEMQEFIASVVASSDSPLTAEYSERVPVEAAYRVTGGRIGTATGLFFLLFKDQSESRKIDRMRADFIANASHELRTPLASISGFVETLRGPAKDDAVARERFLKIMHDQTGRMSRLIDDLLSLSRLEMKSHGRATDQVDVKQVLESVIDSLRPLASDLSVRIETDFGTPDTMVPGDRDDLFQVFQNLLENACKYGQAGGRIVVSMKRAAEPDRDLVVTVRDFGPGIAEEHIPRITERFYRVDVQSSRAQKGTGLGLAIVKHILTRHGGRLAVRSELGQGAEFTVFLPGT